MNLPALSGATRLFMIVGDPIAQVRSPAGLASGFAARGADAICVPAQVAAQDLPDFLSVCDRMKNLDGLIATVPHKFACFRHCASASPRAASIEAVSIMRRQPLGWHGDQFDGEGFVRAMRRKGVEPAGKRALLVGAGGAGSAIAYALIEAGVAVLAVHDRDPARRDALIERLRRLGQSAVEPGSDDPAGFDLICNATPAGMRDRDEPPVQTTRLRPSMYVGCVITVPVVTKLIEAARACRCTTGTGSEMYDALQELMLDFLLA